MSADSPIARIIRLFVSSSRDVQPQRDVVRDVIASINGTDGAAHGFRLELFRWEDDVAPQIADAPQAVIDRQRAADHLRKRPLAGRRATAPAPHRPRVGGSMIER